jgi:hypothetical protein
MIKRYCRVCESTENEFKKHSGNTKRGICKPCHNKYTKESFGILKGTKLNA